MATGTRIDPYRNYNFLVEIDGITRAGFRECSGLDSSSDPIEYREGGDSLTMRKQPGMTKYSNISLKRGVTDDAELYQWWKSVMDGNVQRRNLSILLLDDTGVEKLRWNVVQAWPTKWTGPTFNATAHEVAIEGLDIVHEGVSKV